MDAIALDRSRDIDQIFIKHGHESNVVLRREIAKNLIECADVVRSIVRRQRDAGKQDLHMSFLKRGEHLVEIRARLGDGQAAQSVVASKLDNYDGGAQAQDIGQGCESILCGSAARALVQYFVRISLRIELLLKEIWIRLTFLKAKPGSNAIAEADQSRPVRDRHTGSSERSGRQQRETKCDENEFPNVHVFSVDVREGEAPKPR